MRVKKCLAVSIVLSVACSNDYADNNEAAVNSFPADNHIGGPVHAFMQASDVDTLNAIVFFEDMQVIQHRFITTDADGNSVKGIQDHFLTLLPGLEKPLRGNTYLLFPVCLPISA